jgi:hypothetical protein
MESPKPICEIYEQDSMNVSFRESYETSHEYHYHLLHFQEYLEKSFQNAIIYMPKRYWLDSIDSSGCIHSNLIFSVYLHFDSIKQKYEIRFQEYPLKSKKESKNDFTSMVRFSSNYERFYDSFIFRTLSSDS